MCDLPETRSDAIQLREWNFAQGNQVVCLHSGERGHD